ncbi:prolyl oligopeptidase family serine peptidase [Antrihabitans sp. YC2-6]|uniref:alpha/beta hydrolase family protein n=1 Tax=Antrihabitans sp. YC2-6 TaxID=2799498 RepID=UPI0027DD6946|nr:prolyl oligopeptidase family serine peptidase [Antrihabitans sp. YC2-6]
MSAYLNGEDPLPIIVPDVSGHDATARGLPAIDQLSLRDRAIVRSSAAADVVLRTAAATMVSTALAPLALNPWAARRQREESLFYADIAAQHDAGVSFPRPTVRPRIVRRRANALARNLAHGTVENLTFESTYTPINPVMRPTWQGLQRNNIAHAQHWRHLDGPRPTLCVIHGFFASPYLVNSMFFQLPWFYKSGFDVLLYTLPFHGARAERSSPFSGYGYFSRGMSGFAESMGQAVHDFRIFVDHLESIGVQKVGVTGISLGGYTSALLATVEDRLQVVIPNVPVTDPATLLDTWFPASSIVEFGRRITGTDRAEYEAGMAYHSPLNYRPVVARDSRLIITGLGDRLAPPEQSDKLWLHWDKCALHWFPGNHIVHISQPDYLRRMTRFMRRNDFIPDEWRTRVA